MQFLRLHRLKVRGLQEHLAKAVLALLEVDVSGPAEALVVGAVKVEALDRLPQEAWHRAALEEKTCRVLSPRRFAWKAIKSSSSSQTIRSPTC